MTAGANSLTDRVTAPSFGPSPTVPAHDLQAFLSAFEKIGYDRQTLMAAVGMREVDFLNPDKRIACSVFGALIACAQEQRRTPNLALAIAQATPLGSWPLLDYLVLTSDTVSAGVQQLPRYFRLTTSPVAVTVREDDVVHVELTSVAPFGIEYDTALMILHFRLETDGRFAASSIRFQHRSDDPGEFERVLGCPVILEQLPKQSGSRQTCSVRSSYESRAVTFE